MYTNSENERSEFLATSMIPAKLIPKLDLPVKTVARKATTKPGTVPIKSFVHLSFSLWKRTLTNYSA